MESLTLIRIKIFNDPNKDLLVKEEINLSISIDHANNVNFEFTSKTLGIMKYVYNKNETDEYLKKMNKFGLNMHFLNLNNTLSTTHLVITPDSDTDYKNLENFLEEVDRQKTNPIQSTSSKEINIFKSAFNHHFIKGSFFDELKDNLNCLANNWKKGKKNLPVIVMCQSSGHGKTKCMREFAEENLSIFLCLRGINIKGVPFRSPLANDFLNAMSTMKSAETFLINLLYNTLIFISENIEVQDPKKFSNYQPWLFFGENNTDQQLFDKYKRYFQFLTTNYNHNLTSNDLKYKFNSYLGEKRNLFVFIDEASPLLDITGVDSADSQKLSKFCVMRRSIKNALANIGVGFLVTDTNSKLTNFVPSKIKVSSTNIPVILDSKHSVFYKVLFTDLLIPRDYYSVINKNPMDFLKKRKPFSTIFLLGRPLWGSLINQDYKYEIMNYIQNKILNNDDWQLIKENEEKFFAALAIFSTRTTLSLDYNIRYGQELVSRHMATLFFVDENRESISFKYISEPIMAAASAGLMSNIKIFTEMIEQLNRFVICMNLNATGSIGEIVAELILQMAFDRVQFAKKENLQLESEYYLSYAIPITVEEYLISLVGQENYDTNLKPHIDGELLKGLVCFNHFIKKLDELTHDDACHDFIGRCAAGQFKNHEKGFDLFIPIALEKDVSYILIQVKNHAKHITESEVELIKPREDYFIKDNKGHSKIRHYIGIVMSLGQRKYGNLDFENYTKMYYRGDKEKINITHFILHGLNKDLYPFLDDEQLLVSLEKLVNCDRSFLTDTREIQTLKHVAMGNVSFKTLEKF